MKYADPHACPACRGAISGGTRCPHCDFDLTSPQAHRLWALFVKADAWVAEGRKVQALAPGVGPESYPQVAQVAIAPVAPPRRSWSTGSILLGLGAVCLVVAAIIFTTVAWGSLGILGRALILLVVTAAVGTAAAWATRRRLTGTAEALWAVFLGLITVDVLAAVAEGLFGLGWGDFALVSVVWTAVIVAAGVAVVRWARTLIDHELLMPQLAAGLAPWISAPAVMGRLGDLWGDDGWFWAALIALTLPVAVTVLGRRLGLRWAWWPGALLALCLATVLVFIAGDRATAGDPPLTFTQAVPTLVLVGAAVAAAVLVRRLTSWFVGFAVVALLYLVAVAASGWAWQREWEGSPGLIPVAVLVAVIALVAMRDDAWSLGARWGALVVGAALVLWAAGVAVVNLQRIEQADWFSSPPDVWVRPTEIDIVEGWTVLAVVGALLVGWWALGRWPSPRVVPPTLRTPIALVAGGAAVVTAVASTLLPFLVHAIVLVVVGALLAFLLRPAPWWFSVVPLAVVSAAMVVIPQGASVTAWAWGLATAGFAACALAGFDDDDDRRRAVSAGATGLAGAAAIATIGQIAALADLGPGWWGTIIAAAAAAALLLSLALDDLPWHRLAVEIVAGLALLAALTAEGDHLATMAFLLTIGAVAAAVVGLLDDDRPYLRWVSLALVALAWVARLAASEVETVEAYTAPFAVALLVAGVWRLYSDPDSRSWTALAPGLTLALLPSLPQALDDPTGRRALLLALVAAAVLAAGVVLRWGAPVIAGSAILLLLVLANVGPSALGLQRWILIAAAGLVLLVVGTTWEKRVAEGRALVARIAALR